jgi:hypothetical protein
MIKEYKVAYKMYNEPVNSILAFDTLPEAKKFTFEQRIYVKRQIITSIKIIRVVLDNSGIQTF